METTESFKPSSRQDLHSTCLHNINNVQQKFSSYYEETTSWQILDKYICNGKLKFYPDRMLFIYLETSRIKAEKQSQNMAKTKWKVELTDENDSINNIQIGIGESSYFIKQNQDIVSHSSDWISISCHQLEKSKLIQKDGSLTIKFTVTISEYNIPEKGSKISTLKDETGEVDLGIKKDSPLQGQVRQVCLSKSKVPPESFRDYLTALKNIQCSTLNNKFKVFQMCPDLNEIITTETFTSSIPIHVTKNIFDFSLKGTVEKKDKDALYFYLEYSSNKKQTSQCIRWSSAVFDTFNNEYLQIGKSVFNIKDTCESISEKLHVLLNTVQDFVKKNQLVIAWFIELVTIAEKQLFIVTKDVFGGMKTTTKTYSDSRVTAMFSTTLHGQVRQVCLSKSKVPPESLKDYLTALKNIQCSTLNNKFKVFQMCPDLNEIITTETFTSSIPIHVTKNIFDFSLKGTVEKKDKDSLYFYLEYSSNKNQTSQCIRWSSAVFDTFNNDYLQIGKSVFNIKDTCESISEKLHVLLNTVQDFVKKNQLVIAWFIELVTIAEKQQLFTITKDVSTSIKTTTEKDFDSMVTALFSTTLNTLLQPNQKKMNASPTGETEMIDQFKTQVTSDIKEIRLIKNKMTELEQLLNSFHFNAEIIQGKDTNTLKNKQSEANVMCDSQRKSSSSLTTETLHVQFTTTTKQITPSGEINYQSKKSFQENLPIMISTLNEKNERHVFKSPQFKIDLLLIGKTGKGKSALGNSILGRRYFESMSSSTSVTKSVTYELVEYKGKVIKVVDGPGVGDTDLTDEESQNLIVNSLSEAISINHLRGYHAFLLVVKFGERYTKECRMTVDVLKIVFGANFVKNFVILVMTYGDLLEDESFRDWLDEQKGNLKELVKECDNRVILFDNKTKDKIKRDEQKDALLDLVQMLALNNGRYTDKHFDQVKLSRESLTVESEKILIKEEFMQEAILILKTLQLLQADTENINSSQTDKALQKLSVRTNTLLEKLKTKDKNTGILFELISHFQSLSNAIDDEKRLVQRICQLIKKKNPDVQRKLSDIIRYQKSVFYLSLVEGTSLENTRNQSENMGSSTGDEGNKEIDRMKVQWEKTRDLEAEQKKMKKSNTSDMVGTFQSRVRTTLRNSLKEKSKDVKS